MKAILTKYIPPTNTKPSRIKAYDGCGNSYTLPYNGGFDFPAREAAIRLVRKMQWNPVVLAEGGTPNGKVFVMLSESYPLRMATASSGNLFIVP